jgi:hypothetical protein
MPARYAMERGAWREAMQLQPQPSKILFADAITFFARALGAARNGDTAAAEKDAEELARLHKALQDAKNNYWATEVEIQRLAVAGWIALAQGKPDDAQKLMHAAADLEDKKKHPSRPVVSSRARVAEMLLDSAAGWRSGIRGIACATKCFRGYYGAARAAEAATPGNADYYETDALAKTPIRSGRACTGPRICAHNSRIE